MTATELTTEIERKAARWDELNHYLIPGLRRRREELVNCHYSQRGLVGPQIQKIDDDLRQLEGERGVLATELERLRRVQARQAVAAQID